ncbi:unnamed protein product [Arabis nemorensis]|uniref:Hydrophobic seed protein domain-containing protein n=1 Tax=Arabis nemorensis TaxID=586526 RepID=A0A565BD16_9BRAS|nr:unnamed protein product [Arabis nemorensis]
MKAWMLCLLVICAAVIAEPVEGRNNYIDYGALNPCHGPNPPPGCNPPGSYICPALISITVAALKLIVVTES